jgi:hypothetical protein
MLLLIGHRCDDGAMGFNALWTSSSGQSAGITQGNHNVYHSARDGLPASRGSRELHNYSRRRLKSGSSHNRWLLGGRRSRVGEGILGAAPDLSQLEIQRVVVSNRQSRSARQKQRVERAQRDQKNLPLRVGSRAAKLSKTARRARKGSRLALTGNGHDGVGKGH